MGLSSFPVTMLFFNWLILGGRASFPPPDNDAIALQCCPLPLVPQQSPNHAHTHYAVRSLGVGCEALLRSRVGLAPLKQPRFTSQRGVL